MGTVRCPALSGLCLDVSTGCRFGRLVAFGAIGFTRGDGLAGVPLEPIGPVGPPATWMLGCAFEPICRGRRKFVGRQFVIGPVAAFVFSRWIDHASDMARSTHDKALFSGEDLGSNRLGAAFGEFLRIKDAEASRLAVSQHLRTFLASRKPVPPEQVNQMKGPNGWHTVSELLSAFASGLGDLLISKAY